MAFNTLVNNTRHIVGEDRPFAPSKIVIANNIVQGNAGTLVNLGCRGFIFEGNILCGAAANGNIPTSGFMRRDPQLVLEPSVSTPPLVITQTQRSTTRTGVKDVGADERTYGPVINRPLRITDVGPHVPKLASTPGLPAVVSELYYLLPNG